ncbi:MAG TPA: Re/Si-specific NAD(P)(+) transhydrogenase subunit alpha [Fimbriimonadaceae bacterium]|nr:Re/Si-specific NAD(P)(+) transhydrogenase subunit alpha [Fimbriimonadaceae bacterium]
MKIGVVAETVEGERRVALTPEGVKSLKAKSFEIIVQSGAGEKAGFLDPQYTDAGAQVVPTAKAVYEAADLVAMLNGPSDSQGDAQALKQGSSLLAFLYPGSNPKTVATLASKNVSAFAMELVPRITRAQSMDALSSMGTIAGYKAALLAADKLPKFFPMFMTAAGTISAARVLILGAGVAGLQAISTCRRLGAVVEAFDVRPAVKEQVESLGAKFVELKLEDDTEDSGGYAKELSKDSHAKELELIGSRMAKCDVVITTALIPGKPAPVLITKEMVKLMHPGAVIVDLAASNGGNCEGTVAGKNVVVDHVTICGPTNLLSEVAFDASKMYSKNVCEFLGVLAPEGAMKLDLEDQILRDTLVTHEGKITHEPTRLKMEKEVAAK